MSTETQEGVVEESVAQDDADGTADTAEDVAAEAIDDAGDEDGRGDETACSGAVTADDADPRNGVAVHFENGDVAAFAFVVRAEGADWLYAERLTGGDDGFGDSFGNEEIEALNADQVCRITAPRVHLFGDGVVHFGDDLLVEPTSLLEDSWFDADATLR